MGIFVLIGLGGFCWLVGWLGLFHSFGGRGGVVEIVIILEK